MAIPTFVAAGDGNGTTGSSLTAAYPASGLASGDIAICHAVVRSGTAADFTWPGDWTEVADVDLGHQAAWAWKRLDGTETGSISIGGAPGGGTGSYARMYVFRGCVASGTPYEAATQTNGATSTTYSSSAITTLGTDRLAICLVYISDDDKTIAGMTGSNVTWAESVAEFASNAGSDGTLSCQQANVAAITSITAGSESYTGAETWITFTFALIPATTAVSLDSQPGSFAFTGLAAILAAGRLFDAALGTFTLTGIQAQVVVGRVVSSDPGAYAVTGSAATLVADRALSADPGAFAVTGSAATLAAGWVFAADPSSYAVSGTDASLVAGYVASSDPASFAVTGTDADLVYVPAGASVLDAQPGVYAVTGADAGLEYGALISIDAQPGAISVTGTDATVAAGLVFSADPGVYSVTGISATVVPDWVLSADPGSYAVAGTDATTVVGRALAADPANYAVTGTDAGLVVAVPGVFVLDATAGTYTVSGINATAIATRELDATPGTHTVTGVAATLFGEHNISAAAATYAVIGADATVLADRLLAANPGAVVFTGVNASVGTIFDFDIDSVPGTYTIAGTAATLTFVPGLARSTTRGGRIRWNTTGTFRGENHAGRITQTKEGAVT